MDYTFFNNLKSMGTCYEWKRKARSKVKGACTVELLRRRFPILKWLPSYNWDFAVYAVIAGITVGLTTIPQGIAYASVAGLPLQECSIGPTAVISLMTFSYASDEGGPIYSSTLLAFLAGSLELVAGLLNLGFMVEFISALAISGFCSAAALTVSSTQV
ncbi:sodium-independent sulfate anion transporter-like [Daphnia pulicaria]|uniref:sodium-independent sulfate anion transporter-like n=1 Tax=Daphnia pulicaria TaxID=35523 RepID=UPI001EEB17AE|nr:sodium-independent sulfate anion transporter-like [Daphnia pulicaria]XP_046630624.1 sodium-independent sulfate anion transporter-like [Daphnia pulicaria]